jgi:hypothetical protein
MEYKKDDCHLCGKKLTQDEINDNIYLGSALFTCYSCIDEDEENEQVNDDDDVDSFLNRFNHTDEFDEML